MFVPCVRDAFIHEVSQACSETRERAKLLRRACKLSSYVTNDLPSLEAIVCSEGTSIPEYVVIAKYSESKGIEILYLIFDKVISRSIAILLRTAVSFMLWAC